MVYFVRDFYVDEVEDLTNYLVDWRTFYWFDQLFQEDSAELVILLQHFRQLVPVDFCFVFYYELDHTFLVVIPVDQFKQVDR